jgi:hypothetical protein
MDLSIKNIDISILELPSILPQKTKVNLKIFHNYTPLHPKLECFKFLAHSWHSRKKILEMQYTSGLRRYSSNPSSPHRKAEKHENLNYTAYRIFKQKF